MSNVLSKQNGQDLGLELPRASQDEIKWEVSFSKDNFKYVADWTYEELERITRYQSNVQLPSEEELEKYFTTLTYCRVKVSRGEKLPKGHKPSFLRRLFVPARFSMILSMIGEVVYPDVAVRIVAATSIKEEEIYTYNESIEVAQKLERFFEDGFCGVVGVSCDRYGDPHFMNKIAIIEAKPQTTILSVTKDNPLYGFLAWIMNAELLDAVYDEAKFMLRVNYSSPDIYRGMARRVWTGWKPEEPQTKNNEDPYKDGALNVRKSDNGSSSDSEA